MTDLRTAAQQALEALYEETAWFGPTPKGAAAIAALRAALAQQEEPVARECSDPMCACRGGPCAECEEGEREKEIEDLRCSLYFYQRRCEALQSWQSKMRDPERTIVCDILANGKTLDPAFAGDRYTAPPQQEEPVQEPVAWIHTDPDKPRVKFLEWSEDEPGYRGRWGKTPLYTAPPRCPNCASLEAQNNELHRNLAKLEKVKPAESALYNVTVIDDAHPNGIPWEQWVRPKNPPQRQPLTEEEIVKAVREADLDWQAGWTLDERAPNRFATLARAIERAHGIGETK